MGWHYEPMKTKFEQVVLGTLGVSIVGPIVLCMVADAYARTILEWFGFLWQMIALGMAAYEVNQLDVGTFKGSGFLVRMGWRKPPMVKASAAIALASVTAAAHGQAMLPAPHDLEERIGRLETLVENQAEGLRLLRKDLTKEAHERGKAMRALQAELSTKVVSVEEKLKEATLGNDLERVYAALILGLVGTVLSTFHAAIGAW